MFANNINLSAFTNNENVMLAVKVSGGVILTGVVSYCVWRKIYGRGKKRFNLRDTVILHHPGRGPSVPSMVPFAVKLETYLRMANIPYENAFSRTRSSKNKFPWMEYNDDVIEDSEFCIEYLNNKLRINLDKDLTAEQQGTARAVQKMLEENTYWTIVLDRWVFDKNSNLKELFKVPFIAWIMLKRRVHRMAYGQGMGRHNEEEVYHIMDRDYKAVSDILGEKKFLLGDRPCQADCAVFGMLSQAYWQTSPRGNPIFKKYKNLCDYCERMKETFWPDWDACTTK